MLKSAAKTLLSVAAATALTLGAASAQTLSLATDAVGTTYNAVGSGFAKVITENSDVRVIVRPFGGPDSYLDQLDNGELHLATMSASSAFVSYIGRNKAKKSYRNIRLIRSGVGGLYLGFVAYQDSPIKKVSDLRGKRVASDFGGHAIIGRSVTAALATAGMTWDDVKAVPVTGANDGVKALEAGRVDASWASLGQPVVRELHAKKKIRYLGFDNTPESIAILREKVFPGAKLVTVETNPGIGIPEPVDLINYDANLIASKDMSDDAVKKVLEAVWNNADTLTKIHRGLSGFKNEAAVTNVPMIPYHPAAIAFYKEKGIWTEGAEMANGKFMN
jgi:TRAP transporter TAXI family solute receptor